MTTPRQTGSEDGLADANSNIIFIKSYIEAAKKRSMYGLILWITGLIVLIVLLIDLLTIQWQGIAPYIKYAIAATSLAAIAWGVYINANPGVLFSSFPASLRSSMRLRDLDRPRRTSAQLELELQFAREDRRARYEDLSLNVDHRRSAYKEDALVYIEELRRESLFYRRVNNVLQVIIIAGAATSTLGAGTSYFINQFSIGVAIASFLVAVSSSSTGYFKFKERSFYAQQTADSVEHEIEAYELGIGKYKTTDPDLNGNLELFAQEIHRLRQDQKMREQNLDQPSSAGEEAGN
jgi:hypothetical protein